MIKLAENAIEILDEILDESKGDYEKYINCWHPGEIATVLSSLHENVPEVPGDIDELSERGWWQWNGKEWASAWDMRDYGTAIELFTDMWDVSPDLITYTDSYEVKSMRGNIRACAMIEKDGPDASGKAICLAIARAWIINVLSSLEEDRDE